MMIVITEQDLARMSLELRNELMRLMFERPVSQVNNYEDFLDDASGIALDEHESVYSEMQQAMDYLGENNDNKGKKVVIAINDEQAGALIANLSDKSISTLKYFTSSDAVLLSSLVGANKPYGTYVELKRSFVGPVNRRLRTVTRNKMAVLFKKMEDDGEDSKISVKPETAISLKKILE